MGDLAGKSVLITGGGTGLGADLALGFARAGATVTVAGRRLGPLEKTAALHGSITAAVADVTGETSVRALFDAAGTCPIVIANAGAATSAPFARTALSDWRAMLEVNLTGVFLTLREAANRLRGAEYGRLIAIASTAGLKGYPYVSGYAAAKHGVVGLVRSAALELARTGITVNALCPGFLDTGMTGRSVESIAARTGKSAADALQSLENFSPQSRLIQPAEVTAAALWLCAPEARGVTGQAISISGGET